MILIEFLILCNSKYITNSIIKGSLMFLTKVFPSLFPTMLIGGTLSMLIPTVGVSFTNPQVYQYFLFHAYIVGFAIYLISKKIITIETKTLFRNLGILFGIMFIGIWINSMLSDKAVNFLYLSRPPMDNLPLLNLDHGWYVYFFTLIGIAVILMTLLHLPFIIVNVGFTCPISAS